MPAHGGYRPVVEYTSHSPMRLPSGDAVGKGTRGVSPEARVPLANLRRKVPLLCRCGFLEECGHVGPECSPRLPFAGRELGEGTRVADASQVTVTLPAT